MNLSDFTIADSLASANDIQRQQAALQNAQDRIKTQQANDDSRSLSSAMKQAQGEFSDAITAKSADTGRSPSQLSKTGDLPTLDLNGRVQDLQDEKRRQDMIDRANTRDALAKSDAEAAGQLDPHSKIVLDNSGVDANQFMKLRELSKDPSTNQAAYQQLQGLVAPLVKDADPALVRKAAAVLSLAGREFAPYQTQPGPASAGGVTASTGLTGSIPGGNNGQDVPLAAGVSPAAGQGYLRTADGRQFVLQNDKITSGATPADPNTSPFAPVVPPHRADIVAGRIPEPPAPRAPLIPRAINAGIDLAAPVANTIQQYIPGARHPLDAAAAVPGAVASGLDAAGNAIRGTTAPAVSAGMQAAGAAGDAAGSFLQERIQMAKDLAQKLYAQGTAPHSIFARLVSHFPDLASIGPGEAGAAEIPGDQAPDQATIAARMARMGDLSGGTPAAPAQPVADPGRAARIQQMIQELQAGITLTDPNDARRRMQQIQALRQQL